MGNPEGESAFAGIRHIPLYPVDMPIPDGIADIINRPVLRWNDPRPEELKRNSTRVFVSGHMVDNPAWNMNPSRFPDTDESIEAAAAEVRETLERIYDDTARRGTNLELVFCSGTAGMDLIALEWAAEKIEAGRAIGATVDVSVRAFLPYNAETFRRDAVAYGSHAARWEQTFNRLQSLGLIVEPEFKNRSRRKLHPVPPSKEAVGEEIRRRYGTHPGHYTEYDELNDRMVRLLRKGDYVLALWDGKQPRARGGTLDALYKAFRRIGDETHILFVEDRLDVILPNKQPYRDGKSRSIREALRVRDAVRAAGK